MTKCLDILGSAAFVFTIPSLTCLSEVPQLYVQYQITGIHLNQIMDFPTSQNVFGLDNMNFFANMLYLDYKKNSFSVFCAFVKEAGVSVSLSECQVPTR